MLNYTSKYKGGDDFRSFEHTGRKILWLKNRKQWYVLKKGPVFVARIKIKCNCGACH
jgi:hypothetical protein